MRWVQLVLLAVIVAVLGFSAWKLYRWNQGNEADTGQADTQSDETGENFYIEILDQVYRLTADQLAGKKDDGKNTILCLGNDTFAWDYEGGLTKALAEETGAEILNGAFPGSTVTVKESGEETDPGDVFSFYHIAMCIAAQDFSDMEQPVRDRWEENYNIQFSYDAIKNADYEALDTILIYYDAQDYLKQRSGYNPDEEKRWTDIHTVSGAYASGIRAIQKAYPHIRMVLVTPALVMTYTPEGNPVSADRYDFGHGTLTTYIDSILQVGEACGVTVLDNYHGMTDEENSNGYMVDTTHLSEKGNIAVAKHVARVL
ncbi:MAG: hypothetical protein K5696_01570 [Lachnospiraceae bacterium]|nr:hypothetical protein [Lachnospiraceae bacterium]